MPNTNQQIQSATEQTVQSIVRKPVMDTSNVFTLQWMSNAGLNVSPWWSPTRDRQLRDFWKKIDYLSGAVYTMQAKMQAIPFRVMPINRSSRDDIDKAARLTDLIWSVSDFGNGWVQLYGQFVEEVLTQDNGTFLEIIGSGDKSQAIVGQPIAVAVLDSARCTRTGNAIYPVIYQDDDGKRYKLHFTRVMFTSQMTSPIREMHGVGFSAVSRSINVAQTLLDILVYKQEKLGSRPHREILITKGGLDPNDLKTAFSLAESNFDQQGLTRYSKMVVGGSSTLPEADVTAIELSSLPDGFDEQTSITLGMATIALAFGVDARELFPSMGGGATRADALLQHLKQRGKGPGQIIQVTEQLFNFKFLPPRFRMEFDFQDDAQDRQVAEIRGIRASRRVQDMSTGAVPERILREQMVEDGEVSRDQFERMELESGRLPDGSDALALFQSKNPEIKKLLKMGVEDPTDKNNDPERMLDEIHDATLKVNDILANSTSEDERWNALLANSALVQLELIFIEEDNAQKFEEATGLPQGQGAGNPMAQKPGAKKPPAKNYVDPRVRTQETTAPTKGDRNDESHTEDTSDTSQDDEE